MPQLKRKIIAFTALLMLGVFFLSSSPALAASAKETLTADNWIILQVPIPFPGCSNAALKNNVKCCNEEIIKTYYAQTSSGLGQTYKSAAPICPLGSVAAVKDIPSLILVAVQFMTIVIIIMMVLLMIVSGIQYIVSFGNAEKAKKSLERVKHGAFGLVIVLFSSVILYQVNPKLLTLSITKPGQIDPASPNQAPPTCCKLGQVNKPKTAAATSDTWDERIYANDHKYIYDSPTGQHVIYVIYQVDKCGVTTYTNGVRASGVCDDAQAKLYNQLVYIFRYKIDVTGKCTRDRIQPSYPAAPDVPGALNGSYPSTPAVPGETETVLGISDCPSGTTLPAAAAESYYIPKKTDQLTGATKCNDDFDTPVDNSFCASLNPTVQIQQ